MLFISRKPMVHPPSLLLYRHFRSRSFNTGIHRRSTPNNWAIERLNQIACACDPDQQKDVDTRVEPLIAHPRKDICWPNNSIVHIITFPTHVQIPGKL
jgi:hypothetical protein